MDGYKQIKDKIKGKYNSLPRNHKKIADYFIDNFDKIPFLNVQDIAKSTGTSVASVVRFAQRVGFEGFSEIRDAIAETFQDQINNKVIFPLFDKNTADDDLLTEVANVDIANINNTLNIIERKTFDYVINRILKADRVFTAGLGISYLLAEILGYQLTQVGIDSTVLKHTHTVFHEQVLFMNKKDLLIVFSFPPYSKETVEVSAFAKEKGIDVIAITNKQASPVTFHTKANLIVKSENMLFTNSFAAISVLINAIATACAIKKKSRAQKILKETEEIMESQNQIITGSER
ncbi:MAG TPA: MurR/RpiR family transcriptional regulator [Ignavibacteriaceae bacterium]|nr:MurR/RpiR family transcriptional regulator [Ignavibacteriaceae bacterium]